MMRITKPGIYTISPTQLNEFKNGHQSKTSNSPATIVINCSHVVVDGQGLQYSSTEIYVEPFCQMVQIKNFRLKRPNGKGVRIGHGCQNVIVRNVSVTQSLNGAAIHVEGQPDWKDSINPSNHAQHIRIVRCTISEIGIWRDPVKTQAQESTISQSSCAFCIEYADDVLISGCAIDGVVSQFHSVGLKLVEINGLKTDDVIMTDIASCGSAEAISLHEVDGELKDTTNWTSIFSNVASFKDLERILDTHSLNHSGADIESRPKLDKLIPIETETSSVNTLKSLSMAHHAAHWKNIIPEHVEREPHLFKEHAWKEFRTLERLVAHNSHKLSKTSALYAKWVERFCSEVLGVQVSVVGGFANCYQDGNVPLPLHRDAYEKWVVGLSFGAPRTLLFVPDDLPENKQEQQQKHKASDSFLLEAGDVFLFSPEINHHYQHCMLSEPQITQRRINLTFFLNVLSGNSLGLLKTPDTLHQRVSIPALDCVYGNQ